MLLTSCKVDIGQLKKELFDLASEPIYNDALEYIMYLEDLLKLKDEGMSGHYTRGN